MTRIDLNRIEFYSIRWNNFGQSWEEKKKEAQLKFDLLQSAILNLNMKLNLQKDVTNIKLKKLTRRRIKTPVDSLSSWWKLNLKWKEHDYQLEDRLTNPWRRKK